MSMDQIASSDASGEDRLNALPDDILVLILLRLSTECAARTSVLCSRWRHVWTLLPDLCFDIVRDSQSHRISTALSAGEVPLRCLVVRNPDASPQSVAVWLPVAARRLTGELMLINFLPRRRATEDEEAEEASQTGTFDMPFFKKATSICINLWFLGLPVPPAGVFARLTNLRLVGVRFHGLADLGDAVSSPRCPCLQELLILDVRGLDSITIHSKSLRLLKLINVRGVRQVTVVAPALQDFTLMQSFINDQNQPVANISALQLKSLVWMDTYHPSPVHLGSMEHLQTLGSFFSVYGPHGSSDNHACLMLLLQFEAIEHLVLSLCYLPEVHNLEYLMEDMTMLPDVTSLDLIVKGEGHAFGASSFHVLRICSGIKRLVLVLSSLQDLGEPSECSSDCICDQPTSWKTEKISMNHLQEFEIEGFGASEHEVAFVKRLLNWVPVLKMMTVTCNCSITESKAKELFQMFRDISRPDVCMKFYIYQKFTKVLYAPKD